MFSHKVEFNYFSDIQFSLQVILFFTVNGFDVGRLKFFLPESIISMLLTPYTLKTRICHFLKLFLLYLITKKQQKIKIIYPLETIEKVIIEAPFFPNRSCSQQPLHHLLLVHVIPKILLII